MSTATQISVEEYLSSTYDPDCEYVDGEIEERNVGEINHNDAQKRLMVYLAAREKKLGVYSIQEQRVQISPRRFRVPDVCILAGSKPAEQIVTTPPIVCIEVLSPEDRLPRTQRKIADYLEFGVRYVWV
ncbi:MAG: Uma2 family endonuclease, partial [Bryobacteraceae bacterium]